MIVSVPYKWPNVPEPTRGHVHDPVDHDKLSDWFGRPANFSIVVEEPSGHAKSRRLIAIYDRDPARSFAFGSDLVPLPESADKRPALHRSLASALGWWRGTPRAKRARGGRG